VWDRIDILRKLINAVPDSGERHQAMKTQGLPVKGSPLSCRVETTAVLTRVLGYRSTALAANSAEHSEFPMPAPDAA
jgi:hypothetical protein